MGNIIHFDNELDMVLGQRDVLKNWKETKAYDNDVFAPQGA